MDPLSCAAIRLPERSNGLVLRLAVVCVSLLLPFALNNFFQGRLLLGLLSLPVIALFALNAHCIVIRGHYYTKATIIWLVPLSLLMVAASVVELGVSGLLWSFPVSLSFYLLLPERHAWLANVLLVVVVTLLSYMTINISIALRIFASLSTVSVAAAFLIKIIAEQQHKMHLQTITDSITGAFNSTMLEPVLSHAILQSNRTETEMSLITLDLNSLRTASAEEGLDSGDVLLKDVADVIRERCDQNDRLFRLGYEEFLILLPGTCTGKAHNLAREIRDVVSGTEILADKNVSIHAGIATLQTSDSWREWVARGMASLCKARANKQEKAAA